jgi:hypothetical protein
MKATCKSDSEDIRIYIDGVLHIRIPRDKTTKLHSWVEGHTKLYSIEIWCVGYSYIYQYDNRELWEKILNLFDEHI